MTPAPSRAWDWTKDRSSLWLSPAEESYHLVERWSQAGFRRLLDLGCGRGRHTLQFARRGFAVSAVDLSPVGVAELRDRAAAEGLELDVRVADMMALPFGDGAFDCLLAYHVISHSDTAGVHRALDEVRRVLREGGEFFLTLCSKEAWSFKEAGYPRIDENSVRKVEEGPENGVPHFYADAEAVAKLFAPDELLGVRHVQELVVAGAPCVSWHYFIHGRRRQ